MSEDVKDNKSFNVVREDEISVFHFVSSFWNILSSHDPMLEQNCEVAEV